MAKVIPSVTYLIQGQHNHIQIFHQWPFLNIFPKYLADGIVQAIQDTHQDQLYRAIMLNFHLWLISCMMYLIFMAAPHYIEIKIHIALIDTGHIFQHYDFCVGSMCFGKQVLLKSLLLFCRRKCVGIIILGENAFAVIIQDCNSFDYVQRWFLKKTKIVLVVCKALYEL